MLNYNNFQARHSTGKSAILAKFWRNGKSALLLRRETKSIMKQTPLFYLQSVASGSYCWMLQPMVSSDALTERTHRITEDLD